MLLIYGRRWDLIDFSLSVYAWCAGNFFFGLLSTCRQTEKQKDVSSEHSKQCLQVVTQGSEDKAVGRAMTRGRMSTCFFDRCVRAVSRSRRSTLTVPCCFPVTCTHHTFEFIQSKAKGSDRLTPQSLCEWVCVCQCPSETEQEEESLR